LCVSKLYEKNNIFILTNNYFSFFQNMHYMQNMHIQFFFLKFTDNISNLTDIFGTIIDLSRLSWYDHTYHARYIFTKFGKLFEYRTAFFILHGKNVILHRLCFTVTVLVKRLKIISYFFTSKFTIFTGLRKKEYNVVARKT